MNLDKVKLVELLKALSVQSGLNFICTEAIKERELTVYLDNVPLRDAIDIIFEANNLSYDYYPQANLFVVKELGKPSLELKTKVYQLKYIRVEGSRLQEEIKSSLGKGEGEGEGGVSKVQIKEAVEGVLSEYGRVIEEPLTNSLIVVDVPSQFPIIDKVIESLDKPQPKVLIEAEILDVSKTTIDKLGVNWPEDLLKLDITGARATAFPFWGSKKNSSANLATLEVDTTAGGWKNISWSANNFGPSILTVIGAELTLKFLKSQADTRLLARPKVLTLSGETAEIKITIDEAVGIRMEEEEGRREYSIERTETGTKLRVTPQVNPSTKEITLVIETMQKLAKDSGFATTAAAFVTGTIKNPEERSTRTVVRLKDGEVLLIGGLIRREETKDSTKVPFLSDIPFLGTLFKGKTKDKKERELLIFITPHIVEEFSSLPVFKKSKLREQSMSFSRKETITSLLDRFSKVKQ